MLAMEKGGKNVEDARFFGPRVMLLPPKIWNQEQGGGVWTSIQHVLMIVCILNVLKRKKLRITIVAQTSVMGFEAFLTLVIL